MNHTVFPASERDMPAMMAQERHQRLHERYLIINLVMAEPLPCDGAGGLR